MQLVNEAVNIMSPLEMRTARKKLVGWTLETLSQEAKVSVAQLSHYENGVNGLRPDQVSACERVLLRAAAERSQAISALFGRRDGVVSTATAS